MPLNQQNPLLVLMALVGCIGYIGFQVACIVLAFDKNGRANAKAIFVTAVGIAISLFMLIVGLWLL
ncbi:MAG: hypothetical protein RMK18_11850 [Armatimonadota bacterium]|nr:hypothetical protein [Armatimonadota bacterium]MDW8026540.1 hypothetical protein [Armatimonadota bacterium]